MSDILSRWSARARGSPICLVRREKFRFADADDRLEPLFGAEAGDRLPAAMAGHPPASATAPALARAGPDNGPEPPRLKTRPRGGSDQ